MEVATGIKSSGNGMKGENEEKRRERPRDRKRMHGLSDRLRVREEPVLYRLFPVRSAAAATATARSEMRRKKETRRKPSRAIQLIR